ncbi:MAG: cell division protein ZapA [Prevotellaceae bacterium]|nr:cell division protein ZapA [Prevotellaceae bacterium]
MMDKTSEEFLIHVNVAGETLPMTVRRREEAIYRQAELLLNNKIDYYTRAYSTCSRTQILIFAANALAVSLLRHNAAVDAAPLIEMLKGYTNQIDEIL